MTTLQQVQSAQSEPEVVVNENFETVSVAGLFGRRPAVTAGTTWGYYGGRYNGNTVNNGTVTLTNNADNYVVVLRSSGVVSTSTSTTNWNSLLYARLYKVTMSGGAVTAYVDHRMDTNGLYAGSADRNNVTALTSSSGTVTIDCSLGDYFTLALSENVSTISFTNLPGSGKAATLMIRITQDSTARTVTWPASFRWEGVPPAVSTGAGAIDILAITTFDQGTKWDATLSADRA